MDYLGRESAPCDAALWEKIDTTVVETMRKNLVGRRFLTIFGPLGASAQSIQIDQCTRDESTEDGIVKTSGRKFQEIPQLYEDFSLLWRDIENCEKSGIPIDLSTAQVAAQSVSRKEDKLIFFGSKFLGTEGLMNTPGVVKLPRKNWQTGESAFSDVAAAISLLDSKGILGRYVLCLSPDLYYELQRIQPFAGMLEVDRISKLVDGHLYRTTALGEKRAVLICAESQYVDLAVGQDAATAYLEQKDLNHSFRIIETVLPRIKNSEAIVVFE